jgi:hypothetical protein
MMNGEKGLTLAELLSLDALISVAQQRGRSFDDRLDNTEEIAEAQMAMHEAMWEARHGGLEVSQRDREILSQIRDLAMQLEMAPSLGQLIEIRGEALRQQG